MGVEGLRKLALWPDLGTSALLSVSERFGTRLRFFGFPGCLAKGLLPFGMFESRLVFGVARVELF
jgi:hypothetical protein